MKNDARYIFACLITAVLAINLTPAKATSINSYSQNADTVGRFEKLEITFTLDQTYSNPFDPCVIDITVDFIEPGEETFATIPAFFYQSYTVSGSNPETYNTPGATCWKVRFAPSKIGTHTFDIIIRDSGGLWVYSSIGTFECVEGTKKGFIRVAPNNHSFLSFDNGDTLLNIGQNIGWNNGSIPGGGIVGWNYYLTKMHNAGGNWVRLWNCRYGADGGTLLEWKNGTYGGYYQGAGKLSMQIALRLDKYVEIAEQNGVNIQLALQHHGQFSTDTDADWNDNPYRDVSGGWLSNPAQFFTDANAIRYTKNKYRYIVARWGYSPAIFAWELFNEVQWTNGWKTNQASVVSWHNTMADYIHSIDPFQHPVTTSSHGSGFENIWSLPDINLVEHHYYGNDTIRVLEQTALSLADFNKPVIMAEFGLGGNPEGKTQPEPMATQLKEGLEMHNGIWSSFFAKSSAHLWWWDNYIDPCNLYGVYTPLAVYAANENLADYNLVRAQRAASGAEAYFGNPVLSNWDAVTTQFDFYLSVDYFPGMEHLSQWLQGSWQPPLKSDPNFHLNMPTTGNLKIHVLEVAANGTNRIRVRVNGTERDLHTFTDGSKNFTYTVPYQLSAGQQAVKIENAGDDWFHISSYEFAPTNASPLDSIGLSSNERAYIWIYDVNSQYGLINSGTFHNEPVIVKGLDNGPYFVKVYATRGDGGVIASDTVYSASGVLTYTLPDFSKDIAVKVRPTCPVSLDDVYAFCGQWLSTGSGLDADLAGGGSVDFADFSVLAGAWEAKCPAGWPY
jgi:hypothetical protein